MFKTKKDVDKHVTDILQRIKNENERSLRGYTFAKMYFLVQEYECAKRYLAGFLSLKERDAAAHKLMGQIYEQTKYLERALQSYKRSLELQENQKDVVLKICELYCQTPVDPERARYWADRAEMLFPNHETVFRLRECIVTADGESNSQELEDLIAAELAKRPRDVSLRIKLIKLYLDAERSDEAYQHAVSVESKRPYVDSLDWYYCLTDTFEVYSEECGRDLTSEFYVNALNAYDRLVYLCLEEKLTKNKFISQVNHVTSIADCAAALHTFDQTLYNAWQLPESHEGFWAEYLNHMRGQLFFHIGTLILKKAKKDQVHANMKEAGRMASALFLAAYLFKPPELHSSWFVQANETKKKDYTLLYTEACFRLSQTGHVIIGLCKEDRSKWLQKVRQQACTPQGKEKIFQRIFSIRESQTLATSYFMDDVTLLEFSPEFPDPKTLQDYDETAHLLYPDSLHHVVWLALQYYTTKQKVQPDYKFQIFSGLQFSVNNLNSASPESLCQLDIDAFVNATVQTAALFLEERNSVIYSGHDTPSFFPACISTLLCTNEQSDWWTAAYLLFKNLAKEKLGDLRRTLQRGIEVVRVLGVHGMDVNLIVHLAETFAERARELKEQNENAIWRHLESRAALYWQAAISMLERLNKNQTCVMPKERLFTFHSRDLSTDEVKKLLDDGRFFLACQAMNANKQEDAIEAFDNLKSPYASYYQALIYKKLAADECNQPRELITSEMRSKHIILLTRARDALYVTLDRLQGNRKHPLNQVLSYEIEDIETKLARIDPDTVQRHDFDGLSDECLSSQDSDEPEVESSHQEAHNITAKSSTPHVTLSLRHDSPDQLTSRHREEHTRPSPERLDAQLRFLTHAHETVLKTFVDQNKAVMESSKHIVEELKKVSTVMESSKHIVEELKKINIRLEEIHKQVSANRMRSRMTRVRGGMSNRGGFVRPPPQQIPESVAQPSREEEEENEEEFYDGYYYEDDDYPDPTEDATYQDYTYNSQYKFNEQLHNEYPQGHVTGLHGTSTVTYAPLQNNTRSLLGQPATGYPGYYPPSPATAMTPQGPLPPGYFGTSGHTISAGLPFTEGQKLPEFNFNPSLLPLQNNATPAPKDSVFSRLGNTQQPAEDANALTKISGGSASSIDGKSSAAPHAFQITMPTTPTLTVTSPFQGTELVPSESPPTIPPKSVDRSASEEQEDESAGSDFKPLIPLPDEIEIRTGEEEERPLFEERAKLFRFVGKEWKERGIGLVKLLANEKTGKCRILMRRDQVWKICANHFITPDMNLAPLKNLEIAWVWAAQDYADETVKTERFCIRFKTKEIADNFKTEFDKAKVMGAVASDTVSKSPGTIGLHESTAKPPELPAVGFGDRFKPKSGTWECQTCCLYNLPDRNTCVACETSKPGAPDQSTSDVAKFGTASSTSAAVNATNEPMFKFGFPSTNDKVAAVITSTPIPSGNVFGSPAATASVSTSSTTFTFQRDVSDLDKSKQNFVFGSPQTISPNKLGGGFVFGASVLKNSPPTLPAPNLTKTSPTTSSPVSYGGFTFISSPTIKSDVEGTSDAKDKTNSGVSKTTNKSSKSEKGDVNTDGQAPHRSPFEGFSFSPMKSETTRADMTTRVQPTPEKTNKTKLEGRNLFSILTEGKTEEDKSKSSKNELIFSDMATADSSAFKGDPNFQGFKGFGQSVFGTKSNESTEETEYEPQINFDPLIPMPDLVEIKTGEEDDDKLFGERARLYRFDAMSGQWKERGTGEMKILKNRVTGMCRVLMRREQVYKVCANHRIEAFMQLASHSMSEKLWTWAAFDFSEDVGVTEKFAVRFKTQEQANNFRDVFERCVEEMKEIQNRQVEVVTSTPNQDKDGETKTCGDKNDTSVVPLSELFKPKAGSWECKECYVRSDEDKEKCDACETPRYRSDSKVPLSELFKPKTGSWECKECYVRSDEDKVKCDACETPRYKSDSKVPQEMVANSTSTSTEGPKFLFDVNSGNGGGEGFKFGASPNTAAKLPTTGFTFGTPTNFTFGKTDEKAETAEKTNDVDVGFKFGSPQAFTFSFSGVRPKSPNKTPKSPHQVDKSVESPGAADESTTEDEADQIYFQPVIPLPERVEIKTGEEDEEILYCQRAKLFRFVDNEWKERGLGDIKILLHKDTKNIRLLMRREQIHKVCLNHRLSRRMKFVAKDDKSWMWGATDFADNEPCKETFTVRFKNSEIAKNFTDAIKKAKEMLNTDESDSNSSITVESGSNTSVIVESASNTSVIVESKDDIEKTKTTPPNDPTSTFSFRMENISHGGAFSFGNKFGSTHGSPVSTSTVFGGTPMIFGGTNSRVDVDKGDDDLKIVYTKEATVENREKALKLLLPENFYAYEDKLPCPGCRGCDDENWSFSDRSKQQSTSADFEIVEEPKAEPDQVKQALDLSLPPNFYLYEKKPPCPGCRGCENENKSDDKQENEKKSETESEEIDKPMFAHDPGFDFASIAQTGTEKTSFASSSSFAFDRVGEKLFATRSTSTLGEEDENGDASTSQSPKQKDIHFDPIVPLPDLVELKTGEEDEDKIYCQRAKLYRFDSAKKEWKERGVGDAKILKHKETNRYRLILRRDQIHKIACNHYITTDIVLNPLVTSETAWCWYAMDFADENPTLEQFAIKFKTTELAKEFKGVFEECQRNLAEAEHLKNSKGMEVSNSSHSSAVQNPNASSETETDDDQHLPTRDARDGRYDDDEEGDDDEEDEEDDGDSVMFEKRVSMFLKDSLRGQYKPVGMGNLRVLYDDDFYGARVQVVSDDGSLVCNHLIAMQTVLNLDGRNCFWAAEDYSGEVAVYRYFQATFSSPAAAKDFESTFNEGKDYAKHSDIWERPFNPAGGDNVSDNGTATPANAIKTCSPEISAALEEIIRVIKHEQFEWDNCGNWECEDRWNVFGKATTRADLCNETLIRKPSIEKNLEPYFTLRQPTIFCKKLLNNTVYFAFRQLYTHGASAEQAPAAEDNDDHSVFRDCNSNSGSFVYICNSPAPVTPGGLSDARVDETDYQSIPSRSSVYDDPFDIITKYGTVSERSQLSTNKSRRLTSGMSFVSAFSDDMSTCSPGSSESLFYEPVETQSDKCQTWLDGISKTSSYRDIETECEQFYDDLTEYHDEPDDTRDCSCLCKICKRCKSMNRSTHCEACGLSTSPEDAKKFYYIASDIHGSPRQALTPLESCDVPVSDILPFTTAVEAVADDFATATLTVVPIPTGHSPCEHYSLEECGKSPCVCTNPRAVQFLTLSTSTSPESESRDYTVTRCSQCQKELGDFAARFNSSRPFDNVDGSTSISPLGKPCGETVSTNSGFFLTRQSSQSLPGVEESPAIRPVIPENMSRTQLKDECIQCNTDRFLDPIEEPCEVFKDPNDAECSDENEFSSSDDDSEQVPPPVPPLHITADCSAQTVEVQPETENRGCSPITEKSEDEVDETAKVDVGLQSLQTPASPEIIYRPLISISQVQCPADLRFDVDVNKSCSDGLQLRTDVDEGGMWELFLNNDASRVRPETYRNIELVEKTSQDIRYASTGPLDVASICKQAVMSAISSLAPSNQQCGVLGNSGEVKLNLPGNELEANSAFGSPVASEIKDENSSSEYVTVDENVSVGSRSHDDFVNLLMKLYCELAPNSCCPQDENLSTDSSLLEAAVNELNSNDKCKEERSDEDLTFKATKSDDKACGPSWREHKRRNRAPSRPRCKCRAYTLSPIDYNQIQPRPSVAPRISSSWGGLNTLLDSLVPPIEQNEVNNPQPRYYYTRGVNDEECDFRCCRSNSEADTGYGSVFPQLTTSSREKRMPKSHSTPVPTARRQRCKIHACCCLLDESTDSSL